MKMKVHNKFNAIKMKAHIKFNAMKMKAHNKSEFLRNYNLEGSGLMTPFYLGCLFQKQFRYENGLDIPRIFRVFHLKNLYLLSYGVMNYLEEIAIFPSKKRIIAFNFCV